MQLLRYHQLRRRTCHYNESSECATAGQHGCGSLLPTPREPLAGCTDPLEGGLVHPIRILELTQKKIPKSGLVINNVSHVHCNVIERSVQVCNRDQVLDECNGARRPCQVVANCVHARALRVKIEQVPAYSLLCARQHMFARKGRDDTERGCFFPQQCPRVNGPRIAVVAYKQM